MRDDGPEVRRTVEARHYLRRWPDPRSLPFSYRLLVGDSRLADDGAPWGILVFKKPQHHRQRDLFGYPGLPTSWQVLDLARVWVNPQLQKRLENGHSACIFSRMVAMAFRCVQRDWIEHHPPVFPELPYHVALIISYCQLSHHDGTAYRACNFRSIGKTRDGEKEVYTYPLRAPRWNFAPVA